MNNPQPGWLTTRPVAEVAAAILPLFSYPASQKEDSAIACITSWCKTGEYKKAFGSRSKSRFEDPETRAVAEAIRALERAGLIMRDVPAGNDVTRVDVGMTRLGRDAIATNSVRRHLGLRDAPPTA
jgi:hypothetical protein